MAVSHLAADDERNRGIFLANFHWVNLCWIRVLTETSFAIKGRLNRYGFCWLPAQAAQVDSCFDVWQLSSVI